MRRASISVIPVARCVSLGAVAILVAVVGPASVLGQTVIDQEPRIGTWRLNLEKSQFAGGTAPQMQVRRLQLRRDGFVVFTQVGLDAEGSPKFMQTTSSVSRSSEPWRFLEACSDPPSLPCPCTRRGARESHP